MKKKFILILVYTIVFFYSNLLSDEDNRTLKVGLIAPLSGAYGEIGRASCRERV